MITFLDYIFSVFMSFFFGNCRQGSDNAVSKFLSKASFKSSKKDKAQTNWQYQKESMKKPLLKRTHLREELRRASCRSFLDIL